jgi:hypothetical protein
VTSPRIPLAFEHLPPTKVCALFSRALNRPVTYQRVPFIDIKVSIPTGYRQQLDGITKLFGKCNAPYFGPDLEPYVPLEAKKLWEGWRGMEEYAREVFPVEEKLNGLSWMEG